MRFFLVVWLTFVAALHAHAQSAIAWTTQGPMAESHVILDENGNIFWVGIDVGQDTARVHVAKYSPAGQLLATGSTARAVTGQVKLLKPTIANQRIFVGFGGASSLIVAFQTSDLARTWWGELPSDLSGIHASPANVFTVETTGTTVRVLRRSWVNGGVNDQTTLSNHVSAQQSTVDANGNVYVVGPGTGTQMRFARVNAAGTIAYDNAFQMIGYTDKEATAIAMGSTQVMVALEAQVQGDTATNAILFRVTASTGTAAFWSFNASEDDRIMSVLPQSDGGVVIAMRYWDGATAYGTRIVRRNSSGVLWTNDHPASSYVELRAAQDSLGNVVLARAVSSSSVISVEKLDVESGVRNWQVDHPSFVGNVGVTPTGSPILPTLWELTVFWGVSASFSKSNVVGGQPVTLNVALSRPTPVANLPVLLFSNAPELPVPASVTLPLASMGTQIQINTLGVTANKVATVNVRHAGFIAQRSVTLLPPGLSTLAVTPIQVTGGTSMTGTVSIVGAAPAGGWVINTSSNNSAAVVPSTVTIPATNVSAQFGITTAPVGANTGVVITASRTGVSRTAFVAVNAPLLTTFTLANSSVKGGQNGSLTVNLNGNAPTGGYSILLLSGAPSLVVLPSSTSVAAGSTTRSLAFATAPVTASLAVTLVAYRGSVVRVQTLTLTP